MKKIITSIIGNIVGPIIASALVLTAPAAHARGRDGYDFEKSTKRIAPTRAIRVVLYDSMVALKAAHLREDNATYDPNREPLAFSVITGTSCTIHIIDPKVKYIPEFFGHELTHCLYGDFHPYQ